MATAIFGAITAAKNRNHDGIGDTPYHETDVFGYIVDRHPQARIFALSPAVALLRKGEELLPLLDTPGVTDTSPMMSPVGLGSCRALTFSTEQSQVSCQNNEQLSRD
jgi:nitrous oxidase accessory protein NosD